MVRVVVEEVEQGGKTFYSVFKWEDVSKKLKRAPSPDSSQSNAAGHGVEEAPSSRDKNILYQDRPLVQPFYSRLLAEVESLSQEKLSGDQLLAKLRKTHGVKGEECSPQARG